ncbi:FAD-binding domain-containing protein [Artomyces pyxidatus]|uniref:FAD-binding domain-containing protein n=1 Tax=Artomyces pyxidatus TaxID=48021 RepID=A0ACB8T2Z2_9AGAM|nr:FAD-binding domain-containing protein [Artomyces pyxidatus]
MALKSIINGIRLLAGAVVATSFMDRRADPNLLAACDAVARAVSNASSVHFPPSTYYTGDIAHWSVSSSTNSACSVEPGTPEDVAHILKVLASSRTPFAVKGGGHTGNPGFSSTPGVEISMSRFSEVTVNAATQTVEVGAGLGWDQVYAALDPQHVNVIGGRIPTVGVAGLTLGGGYTWKTNQYGLAIDNTVAYELVLPNGTIATITEADEDLWFGLRGGLNNFGIVTKFTFKSYPQTDVWGGLLEISAEYLEQFKAAFVSYAAQTDKKASLVAAYEGTGTGAVIVAEVFYDAPSPPAGIFDALLAIPTISGTAQTSSFASFIQSLSSINGPGGLRVYMHCAPVLEYTPTLLQAIFNETTYWANHLANLDPSAIVIAALEPLQPTAYSHGSPSAYPPDRSRLWFPSNPAVMWSNASLDQVMHDALSQYTHNILAAAAAEGQDLRGAAYYPAYALYDTPLEDLYGSNVARLKAIKKKYDPSNVMGLAGGFKL